MTQPIRLGISACLLGRPVRYNGGHRLDQFITETLGRHVEFVPVCPEVECGLPVPREAMRLVGDDPDTPRLVTSRSGRDLTDRMQAWIGGRLEELAKENLLGFIFKSGSPSSGMERVKVYNGKGMPVLKGVGMFARAFMTRFPLLPVEDDGRLHDDGLRENFIERLFAMKRWQDTLAAEPGVRGLIAFHTREKLLIMAHSPKHVSRLGALVAHAKERPFPEVRAEYLALLVEALRLKATPAKNANALQHAMGYFKRNLGADEKAELLEVLDHYRLGHVPLIVPVTLVNHYVRVYAQPYLADQSYLHPHPVELKLRNHV